MTINNDMGYKSDQQQTNLKLINGLKRLIEDQSTRQIYLEPAILHNTA